MHLNSKNKPEPVAKEKPCVYIQAFVDNVDGTSTVAEYVAPPSVGTIDDFSVESLQRAGITVNEINDTYMHQSYADMDTLLAKGASKLMSEAEVKELNNLE